jgi:hypothetical protein
LTARFDQSFSFTAGNPYCAPREEACACGHGDMRGGDRQPSDSDAGSM